jgi:hypothetical protein
MSQSHSSMHTFFLCSWRLVQKMLQFLNTYGTTSNIKTVSIFNLVAESDNLSCSRSTFQFVCVTCSSTFLISKTLTLLTNLIYLVSESLRLIGSGQAQHTAYSQSSGRTFCSSSIVMAAHTDFYCCSFVCLCMCFAFWKSR